MAATPPRVRCFQPMPRQPRERVFTLSLVEAWLDANDEKDDDERRELLTRSRRRGHRVDGPAVTYPPPTDDRTPMIRSTDRLIPFDQPGVFFLDLAA